MSKLLNGAPLFSTMNAGLSNTYSVLSNKFSGGITLENLSNKEALEALNANGLSANFKSYLQSNFSKIDADKDGKISAKEVQNLSTSLANDGMTLQQLYQLGTSNGVSSSLLDTVISHFNEIDKNKDGKVTNAEISAYGVSSSVETHKNSDRTRAIKNMSLFHESEVEEASLLDYKYLDSKKV